MPSLASELEARDTPDRRQFEVRMGYLDMIALIVGAVGLALSLPPLVYLGALGHVAAAIAIAPRTPAMLAAHAISICAVSGLYAAARTAIEVLRDSVPFESAVAGLQTDWPLVLASAVVLGGIVVALVSHAGNMDILREYMDREQRNPS